ncbi:MAG: hypothetical protein Q8Q12_11070 [bacterium]|nr:hypothetical protein [bacterium]
MKAKSRFTEAVATLIQETQDGILKWEPRLSSDELRPKLEGRIETLFVARKDPWLIRLYSYKTEDFTGSQHEVALEVSEQGKASWWRFPDEVAIWDLLDAVRFKEARVDEFIDKLVPK